MDTIFHFRHITCNKTFNNQENNHWYASIECCQRFVTGKLCFFLSGFWSLGIKVEIKGLLPGTVAQVDEETNWNVHSLLEKFIAWAVYSLTSLGQSSIVKLLVKLLSFICWWKFTSDTLLIIETPCSCSMTLHVHVMTRTKDIVNANILNTRSDIQYNRHFEKSPGIETLLDGKTSFCWTA